MHNIGKQHAGALEIRTAERDIIGLERAREAKNVKVERSQADMPNSPSWEKFSKGALSSSYSFFILREKLREIDLLERDETWEGRNGQKPPHAQATGIQQEQNTNGSQSTDLGLVMRTGISLKHTGSTLSR